MATPRRRWFALWTEILREPWPHEIKGTLALLGAHMVDRWATTGATAKQATRARLSPGDLYTITGCADHASGIARVRELSALISLRVHVYESGFVEIEWPKFAENLKKRSPVSAPLGTRLAPRYRPVSAPSSSSSSSSEEEKKEEREAASPLAPELLVKLIGKEPGEEALKLAWLRRELPMIEAKASEDHPDDPKRRMAGVRTRVLSHYRQHHKADTQPPRAIVSRINGSGPTTDELSRLSRDRIIQMPTLEYWREWKLAGNPREAFWWVPKDERPIF